MPTVTINGQTVEAAAGQSILGAARAAGITIPTLCYHKDLSVAGSCRLCLVEVEGGHPVPACATPVAEGLVVRTETPELARDRRFVLELLLPWMDGVEYGMTMMLEVPEEQMSFAH